MDSIEEKDISNIKQSLKVTSLFGGVQIFGILLSIVRNKCVALLIGPMGVGLVELYNSTTRLIRSFTDFSINVSAVRDVSVAYKSGDDNKFCYTVKLLSKIVWFTGLLGMLVCLIGSPLWSKFTFGDYNHTWAFVLLSFTLLLGQLQNGKTVLLQGTQHYKYLAYSGIIGNVIGFLTVIPIFYFWGVDGVIPVLILSVVVSFLLTYYYASKIKINNYSLSNHEAVKKGSGMLKQGFLLSINYLLSTLIFYVLRIFINKNGGVEELGLYSASFAITTTYVGMVFQSMGQEYYPRLSTLSSDNKLMNKAIDDQIYLSLLILGPMIAAFLTFSDVLLELLYSSKFTGASMLMAISMFGVLFQAPSWCMAFSMLSKSDDRVFLLTETLAKVVKLGLEIGFYLFLGLTGLGIAFVLAYLYYTVQSSIVCKSKYGYFVSRKNKFLLLFYSFLGLLSLFSFAFCSYLNRFVIGGIVIVITSLYSYYMLNRMINITRFIKNKVLKK